MDTIWSFYDKILHLKLDDLKRMYMQLQSDGWEFAKEKDGIKLYTKKDHETGLNMVRGEGIINAPAATIMETALQVNRNKEWDTTIEESKMVESVDNFHVVHSLMKRMPFIQKREALTVFRPFYEPDGTIYGVGTSIDYPTKPTSKDFVRANVKMAGWILKPLKENPSATFVTYILSADPRGSVPKSFVNWFTEEQGMSVRKLGNFIENMIWGPEGSQLGGKNEKFNYLM